MHSSVILVRPSRYSCAFERRSHVLVGHSYAFKRHYSTTYLTFRTPSVFLVSFYHLKQMKLGTILGRF